VASGGYDAANRLNQWTDPRGIVTVTNLYNGDDRVTKQTAADGGVYSFAYTGGGNDVFATETDVTDPVGSIRKVNFNAAGFPVSDRLAVGTAQEQDLSYSYDPASNLLLSTTDALGRVTAFTYDANGNRTSVTLLAGTAGQVTTLSSYGAFNQLTSVTDPLGNVSLIGLNALGLPISLTDPLGNVTLLQYDQPPNPARVTDPLGNQTSVTYDLGLPVSVTDPLGRVSTQYTDPLGRTIRSTDPLGNATAAAFDPLYGTTQITQPNGEVTSINFQPAGLVGSIVDARTGTTSYAYDAKRRLVTRTDPLGHAERVTGYDGNDHVLSRVDRKGQMASYTYDALGRITTATYADGAVVSYAYDQGDRLTQIQDSVAGTIARSYDGLDRLVSETTPQGTVTYLYDAAGRRTALSVPGQAQVTYAYDAVGRLTQIAQGSAIVTIGYDAAGRRTSLTLPNGIVTGYSYDAASELTAISYAQAGRMLGTLTYGYDLAGNQISRGGTLFQSVLPAAVTSGGYDAANRLNQWTVPGGGVSPSYDANGNLLNDGTRSFTWDARNRLTGITGVASFSYDALGRRQSATINGNTVSYLYDGSDPVQEQAGGTVLANILTGLGIDERFTRTEGTASASYLTDALGSPVALADGSGAIKTSYGYDPYGSTSALGTASDNRYQYAGRENDGTGLYFNRARYYNPAWGRFISEDPFGLNGGINRFAYVGGNPISFRDPLGLWTLHVGFTLGYTWYGAGSFSFGAVVDGNGDAGFYGTVGYGAGTGDGLWAGVGGGFSDAKTICDLGGPFHEYGGSVGDTVGVSGGYFTGDSNNGAVRGVELYGGGAAGLSGSSITTYTWIDPVITW
jgi:RHS repeat-associated protein